MSELVLDEAVKIDSYMKILWIWINWLKYLNI